LSRFASTTESFTFSSFLNQPKYDPGFSVNPTALSAVSQNQPRRVE
jgi:hypothetical protein